MTPLGQTVSLSLLFVQAANKAGIDPTKARRFLDELVAQSPETAVQILQERVHEAHRRANAKNRRRGR